MVMTSAPLGLGSTGRAVTFLQRRLSELSLLGPEVTYGTFDKCTETALKTFQTQKKLIVDGIYGPGTNAALTTAPTSGIANLASLAGIEPRALKAVLHVESAGNGFYDNGLPKILLERHYVYSLTGPGQRKMLPPDVCYATAGGYVGGLAEWDRFERVARIVGETTAIRSCSWGAAQIMGNWAQRIYDLPPQDFMHEMALDELSQISLMIGFIRANPSMKAALDKRDWTAFAKLYNGPNQQGYDKRLAQAYSMV